MTIEKHFDTKKRFTNASEVAKEFRNEFLELDHEELWALFLTTYNIGIKKFLFSIGGLNQTTMDQKRIIKEALLCNAMGIVILHNHPSGNPMPSTEDIKQTEKLKKCCDFFDIQLVDHIVMTESEYFSFSDDAKHIIT